MSVNPVSIPSKRLAASITSTGYTFTLNNILTWDGVTNLSSADFGTLAYGAFRNDTNTAIEFFSFDPSTIANGTITILLRGLSFDGDYSTEITANKLTWVKNQTIVEIGADVPQLLKHFVTDTGDQTITGAKTFTTSPTIPTATSSDIHEAASIEYVNAIAVAGAPNASTTVKGIVELATQAEIDARTATGGTGAKLVPTPDTTRSTLLSDYVADTGAANAYVIAPVPAITAYATGQRFSFKATNANTTTSTLNVSGLGTKTIKKVGGSANLSANDILAGQIVDVEYDATTSTMQMMSPVGNAPLVTQTVKFGGTGTDGALTITSGTTTIDLASAAYVEKNYTSVSITGTGVLAFINPNANGTVVVIRSQGNVTLTSSATPMIDASGLGAAGGTAVPGAASQGNSGNSGVGYFVKTNGGVGGNTGGQGVGGAIPSAIAPSTFQTLLARYFGLFVGAGGGAGGSNTSPTGNGGTGGRGGGAFIIECAGAWNFTTTSGISVAGKNGGLQSNDSSTAGGGGGGAGGFFLALYNTLTANTGTITISGGTGSANATGSGVVNGGGGAASLIAGNTATGTTGPTGKGGDGGAGTSSVLLNTFFL